MALPVETVEQFPLGWLEVLKTGQVTTLPLRRIRITAQIIAGVAHIALEQHFQNPLPTPAEVVYRFPLPHAGGLTSLVVQVGQRCIEGVIAERQTAEREYQTAAQTGHLATLVTPAAEDLYTLYLANLAPGETVVVRLAYLQAVPCDDGTYTLCLPFSRVPRSLSANATPQEQENSLIPYAAPDAPVGPVRLQVAVDAGAPVAEITSPSHPLVVTRLDDRRFQVELAAPALPNRDVILRYTVRPPADGVLGAWLAPRVTAAGQAEGDAVALVTLQPPTVPADEPPPAPPRAVIFVLDRSGSMSGSPLAQAKNALQACLRILGPEDHFAILAFDHETEWFAVAGERLVPLTESTLAAADAFIVGLEARGGTNLEVALEAALALPVPADRSRVIVLLTDGGAAAREATLAAVRQGLGSGRLFALGIGAAVDRALLERLALAGRGTVEFLTPEEDIEGAIIRLQDRLSHSVLTDLEVVWEGAEAVEVFPSRLPDLFVGQPITLIARLRPQTERPRVRIRGRRGEETIELEAPLTPVQEPALSRLWARARLEALTADDMGMDPAATAEGLDLACRYGLLTAQTALLAVDRSAHPTDPTTPPVRLIVPQLLPAHFQARHPSATRFLFAGNALHAARCGDPDVWLNRRTYAQVCYERVGRLEQREEAAVPAVPWALRWLARTQNADGSWGAAAQALERTAAALVALARAGCTARRGHLRRLVQRALAWLEQQSPATPEAWALWTWARVELALADDDRARALRLAQELVLRLARQTDHPPLVAAVLARLAALLPEAGLPAVAVDALADPRLQAVLARSAAQPDPGLPAEWLACLGADR